MVNNSNNYKSPLQPIMDKVTELLSLLVKVGGDKFHQFEKKSVFSAAMKSIYDEVNNSVEKEDLETIRKKFLDFCDELFNETFGIKSNTRTGESNLNIHDVTQNANEEIDSKNEKLEPIDMEQAKMQLCQNALILDDNCESLYRILNSKIINRSRINILLNELTIKIHSLNDSSDLLLFWNRLFDNYKSYNDDEIIDPLNKFMKFINMCGFVRDGSKTIIVTDDTYIRYIDCEDNPLIAGDEMTVISPCWSIGDNVLQRGLLTKIKNDDRNE